MRRALAVGVIVLVAWSAAGCVVYGKALSWRFLGVGTTCDCECPQDAVVVLGGGYLPGTENTKDRLWDESAVRVLQGVEMFKKCDARWLVLSGRSETRKKETQGELMRDLALRLGVPSERIVLETDSANTREHPLFLKATGMFDSHSKLAIVTSPWHLRRAMIEFAHYFPNAVPVASYYIRPEQSDMVAVSLAQLRPLNGDTLYHEYVGILWYWLLRLYPGLVVMNNA